MQPMVTQTGKIIVTIKETGTQASRTIGTRSIVALRRNRITRCSPMMTVVSLLDLRLIWALRLAQGQECNNGVSFSRDQTRVTTRTARTCRRKTRGVAARLLREPIEALRTQASIFSHQRSKRRSTFLATLTAC